MILKKQKQRILKNQINSCLILKFEIKNLILKSILINNNLKNKNRLLSFYLLRKKKKKNKKICLLSGHFRGTNTKLNLSRHNLNYLSKLGLLQNFQIKSW